MGRQDHVLDTRELKDGELEGLLSEIQLLQTELSNPEVRGKDGKRLSRASYKAWRYRKIAELHIRLDEYRKLKTMRKKGSTFDPAP